MDFLLAKDVLAMIFGTVRCAPATLAPKAISFDLSRWAGQKVHLRSAQVDKQGSPARRQRRRPARSDRRLAAREPQGGKHGSDSE